MRNIFTFCGREDHEEHNTGPTGRGELPEAEAASPSVNTDLVKQMPLYLRGTKWGQEQREEKYSLHISRAHAFGATQQAASCKSAINSKMRN